MIENGFWVFGYGSLIWHPEFEYSRKHIARLDGYARSFCMWSIHHRGTQENPGLVLALDKQPKAHCIGVAFFIETQNAEQALSDLRKRELISAAYLELLHPVTLEDDETVDALCYVIDPHHEQYCGDLALDHQAEIIANASGDRGPNTEYLFNTCECIQELGLKDENLSYLKAKVSSYLKR